FTLAALDRDSEALAAFDQVLAANPDHIDALMGRGAALQNLCRYAEAVATYERVVAIDPNHAEAHYSEAMALLSLGHYRSSLPKYEWRRKVKGTSIVQTFAKPLWLAEGAIVGKALLLHAAQGLSDRLHAVR